MADSHQREVAVFEAALQLPPEQREAYLDRTCGDDLELRDRIRGLLRAHQDQTDLLEPSIRAPGMTFGRDALPVEKPGDQIGPYKLLQQIGEGGCGLVYMAEQAEPIQRRVALKIIKLGMDTKQVVARFGAERHALALMDHPNIARVLDAGATEKGRPFFVMELVRGVKITDYCDQNHLSTQERLELFIQVCRAVQHAHQKGIIHRDLKPSNILVTVNDGVAVPKVIDFGIAKATQGRLTDQTVFTAFEQFIGTPAYMSPEQTAMSSVDIDTRSDIYSLGVLLYELLTGRTPFDTKELLAAGLDQMRRTICETEPARPSTRLNTLGEGELTTTAQRRKVQPPELVHLVRDDLDWIVMKCLEKDRGRRYETANGLAMDIQRHLNCEPVLARPPSRLYEFQKTVRRHKFGFGATAALILVLTAGVLESTWQAIRATKAKREALSAEREQSRLRTAAEQAQTDEVKQKIMAQQELYDALVGRARATRLARQVGYRDRVFALLEQAKALDVPQKNVADLRNEAVACLGDFIGLTPVTFNGFPADIKSVCLAPSGKRAVFGLADGTIQLLEMPSGKMMAHLGGAGSDAGFDCQCFNANGDQLFSTWEPQANDRAQFLDLLPGHRLYTWACNADGLWEETGNRSLPGVLRVFSDGTNIFANVVDVTSLNSASPEHRRYLTFRLFDVTKDAFVVGYDVTNALSEDSIWWSAETPDARLLAVEIRDNPNPNSPAVLNLYDWKTGRPINELPLPRSGSVSLSQDGKYLCWLSFSENGGAIYTVPGLERIGRFKEFFARSPAVFSRTMVALPMYEQNRIRLWNLVTREDIARLDEPEPATPMALSLDGQCLITSSPGSAEYARLYRLKTPERLALPSHAAAVPGITFSPDGTRLASVSQDRVVRVCDAITGKILWETNGLPGPGQCVGYSPDGRWLATGDYDTGRVDIWDADTGQRLLELGTTQMRPTWSAQFSPDGRYLAIAGGTSDGGRNIGIYSIGNPGRPGGNQGRLEAKLVDSSSIGGGDLLFAPDGRSLEFKDMDESLWVWDFKKSPQPHKIEAELPGGVQMEGFLPDGHLVAIDQRGTVVILNLPGGDQISCFQARKPSISFSAGICPSPDGSRLAVTSESQRGVEIWDLKARKRLYALPDEAAAVYWLAWSPDSRRVAIARDNGNIAIWNLDTVGHILAKLGLNGEGVPSNASETLKWFRKAADEGNPDVLITLGRMYLHGDRVPVNSAEAQKRSLKTANEHRLLPPPREKWTEARDIYSEILSMKPDSVEAWAGRGNCYLHTGDYLDMAKDYSQAIKLKPDTRWYWHERAYAYQSLGEFKKAISDHSKCIEFGDTDADERWRRGRAYEFLGDFQDAAADYSRAIALNPRYWQYWEELARVDVFQHGADKARADLAEAARRCSTNGTPSDQDSLAWMLTENGDPRLRDASAALVLAEKAVASTSRTNRSFLSTLAVAYAEVGRFTNAVNVEREALHSETNPEKIKWRTSTLKLFEAKTPYHDPWTLNDTAWKSATSPLAKVRDGKMAVALAEEAVSLTSRTNASFVDTLAAAYAETGDFAKAVATEKESIALLTDKNAIADYTKRLKLYEADKPCRAP